METLPCLRYDQALLASLLDDTEDAPWMVTPEFQFQIVRMLLSILEQYIRHQDLPWHVFSELWIIAPWPNDRGSLRAAPDLFVVEADREEREAWQVSREGKTPPFVLEVVTPASSDRDERDKAVIYDQMGVREYVIFTRRGVKGGPRLQGYQRDAEGQFVRWDAGAVGEFVSQALGGLRLYIHGGTRLRLKDRDGHILPTEAEEGERQRQRGDQEAARARREAARADQEATRAEAAERELARLRTLLDTNQSP